MRGQSNLGTGVHGLDDVFQDLRVGDNVVWQVDDVEQYRPMVSAFTAESVRRGRRVVYFRFARHAPLLEQGNGVDVIPLEPSHGFEVFVSEIHEVLIAAGRETICIFDCLSELAADWCSDRMLGNFYMLICPYVYDHCGAAYFALLRDSHSFHATDPVRRTTQILVDLYAHNGRSYIQPQKVQYRHTRTMFLLHAERDDRFVPVTASAEIAEVLADRRWNRLDSESWRRGYWSSLFAQAEDAFAALSRGEDPAVDVTELTRQLRRMLIARSGTMFELAETYLGLQDLLAIRRRMIGTGLLGGKSVGLVMAQAVLRGANQNWDSVLEPTDSFFIGADVFYTFLVQNGLWWIKQRQKNPENYLDGLPLARNQILNGQFPDYIMQQFKDLLGHFGQAPIIVRSSSLLEDDFDSSFAGKAESVLCPNRGTPEQRLEEFVAAVRRVYASNMSAASLDYRAARGLLDEDEQMAILVQRVSGTTCGHDHSPHASGVALSFNPYAWDKRIDPEAGAIRIVFGLGTRAVDPHPDDYTRVVALNEPRLELCESDEEGVKETQRRADLLDLDSGHVKSVPFADIVQAWPELPLDFVARQDRRLQRLARETRRKDICPWVVDFNGLFEKTDFVARMRSLLAALSDAYRCPVDVEFAVNIDSSGEYRVNLLQCRPFLTAGTGDLSAAVDEIPPDACLIRSEGPIIGRSREVTIDRMIYVVPATYGQLPVKDRYAVARLIGELMRGGRSTGRRIMLLGPGRWGTSSPSLGVPTALAELQGATVIGEIATMHEGLTPDLSLGSHFFHELVEMGMLYLAVFPGKTGHRIDETFLAEGESCLEELAPDATQWSPVVKVFDTDRGDPSHSWRVLADTKRQVALMCRTTE